MKQERKKKRERCRGGHAAIVSPETKSAKRQGNTAIVYPFAHKVGEQSERLHDKRRDGACLAAKHHFH